MEKWSGGVTEHWKQGRRSSILMFRNSAYFASLQWRIRGWSRSYPTTTSSKVGDVGSLTSYSQRRHQSESIPFWLRIRKLEWWSVLGSGLCDPNCNKILPSKPTAILTAECCLLIPLSSVFLCALCAAACPVKCTWFIYCRALRVSTFVQNKDSFPWII